MFQANRYTFLGEIEINGTSFYATFELPIIHNVKDYVDRL